MQSIGLEMALQRAKNFRNARIGFQASIQYIVEQALNGNASSAGQIFAAAELSVMGPGAPDFTKDGKVVKAYLLGSTADGGCGLVGVLRYDTDTGVWKMKKNWQDASQKIDYAALWNNLKYVPWFRFQAAPKAKPEFDIAKAMLALAKKAAAAGIDPALFALEARVAIDKVPGAVVSLPVAAVTPAPSHAVH